MNKVSVKVTLGGNPITIVGDELKIGSKAPDFTAVGPDMKPVKLSDFSGKNVVIAVYTSIDTGICAAQNRHFNKIASEIADVVVMSISMDLPFAQKRFCAAEGLEKILTLSDYREREFGLKYGFLIDENKLLARGTVIIDKQGIVKYVEYVPEIGQEPDYDKSLDVLKSL